MDSSVAITMAAHTSLGTWPLVRVRLRRAEGRVDAAPVLRRAAGRVRPDRARGGQRRGQHAHPRAEQDGDDWVINGAKQFITNSGTDISGYVAITARTGDGRDLEHHRAQRHARLRDRRAAYRKMGWNASDTRPLSFEDCRVPQDNLLGPRGQGFQQFLQTLDGGRIGVAAMGLGLAQGALDEALAYAKERIAFGQPISQLPGDPGASSPTSRPRSRPPACSPTRRRWRRTRGATSR